MARNTYGLPDRVFDVIERVADDTGLTIDQLLSEARKPAISHPRQRCYHEIYELCRTNGKRAFSLPMIGRFFKRDHTTILFGIRKHKARNQHLVVDASTNVERDRLAA